MDLLSHGVESACAAAMFDFVSLCQKSSRNATNDMRLKTTCDEKAYCCCLFRWLLCINMALNAKGSKVKVERKCIDLYN